MEGEAPWALVDSFSDGAYRAAARQVARLLTRREEATRGARVLAEREFGLAMAVERYDRLYRRVLADRP